MVVDILQTIPTVTQTSQCCVHCSFCMHYMHTTKIQWTQHHSQRLIATPAIRTFKNIGFYPEFIKKDDFFEILWNLKNSRDARNSKISNFSGSSKISSFHENRGPSFLKFLGIVVDKTPKNARIYGFPEIIETKVSFFPGNFDQNF